jgi:hypothetical protein
VSSMESFGCPDVSISDMIGSAGVSDIGVNV